MSEPCQCSECLGLGPDADSQIALRFKTPDPTRTLPKATDAQVRFIGNLSKKLTKREASRLIDHLRTGTSDRL